MPTPAIFISHSHYDNAACRQIRDFLTSHIPGVDVFLDESDVHGGDDWMRRILDQVVARPIFLVVLSRQSVVAEWVAEETNLALAHAVKDKTRRVIPVQVDPALTLPEIDRLSPLLRMRQIIDLTAGAPAAHWDDLARVVRGEASGVAPHVDAAQAAELERARDYATQTHEAFAQRQYRMAVRLGRFAVGLPGNERDAALWGELGLALIAVGETTEGDQALDTALGINRYRADLWRAKARGLTARNDLKGASSAWDMAIVATSAPAGKLEILAEQYEALMQAGQGALAQSTCDDALELAPNDAAWRQRQRQIRLAPLQARYDAAVAATDWREALAVCAHALGIAPGDAHWQALQAQAQEARRREEAEREEAERNARLVPPTLQAKGFAAQVVSGVAVIVPPLSDVLAGPYLMGSDKKKDPQAYDDELPQHTVTLAAYQIGTYPVTVAEYARAVEARAVRQPPDTEYMKWATQLQRLDHPVVYVSWNDVVAYAAWLAQVTGQPWRLPTEAEWEKAARGTDGRIYPWGNTWDKTRANTSDGGPGTTTPVGAYADKGDASPYGAHDLSGNVWEWCSSLSQSYPYNPDDGRENLQSTGNRVLRGGSWGSTPGLARAAYRYIYDPDVLLFLNRGFRLARGVWAGSS